MRVKTIEERGSRFSLRTVGVVALMVALAIFLASCAEEDQGAATTPEGEPESEGPASGVVVSDITDDPSEYFDATVTISGEVNDIAAPQAFTIGGEDFFGTDELLIVGAQQLPEIVEGPEGEEIGEQDIVQITGAVREFDSVAALEEEVENYEIDDQLFEDYEGEPVVVAEEIFLTPRAERAGDDVPVSIADITDAPEEYFGQTITASGVVAETLEPNAFVLVSEDMAEAGPEESDFIADESVLVVSGGGVGPNLTEGQSIQVTGTFQEFELTAAEQEAGVDLEDGLYADWAGRPAIVAEQMMQGEGTTSQ